MTHVPRNVVFKSLAKSSFLQYATVLCVKIFVLDLSCFRHKYNVNVSSSIGLVYLLKKAYVISVPNIYIKP